MLHLPYRTSLLISSIWPTLTCFFERNISRMPVYEGSLDNVTGVLSTKDLLPYLDKPEDFNWKTLLRKPFFVPESKMIEKKFISYVEQNITGKTDISFGKKNKWLDEFKFHYDEENINEIISNIFKLF